MYSWIRLSDINSAGKYIPFWKDLRGNENKLICYLSESPLLKEGVAARIAVTGDC